MHIQTYTCKKKQISQTSTSQVYCTTVFLIAYMVQHWPKKLLIWHCTVLSLKPVAQLIMIVFSLTALTHCKLAQDVFSMTHTLTIVEPIWPVLQNVSNTLLYMYNDIGPNRHKRLHFENVPVVTEISSRFIIIMLGLWLFYSQCVLTEQKVVATVIVQVFVVSSWYTCT